MTQVKPIAVVAARASGALGDNRAMLQTLRHARLLARLVLAWFALALGVAVASPLVHPQTLELVCSAAGSVKLVNTSDDGGSAPAGHTLDCPLCMVSSAPPPTPLVAARLPQPLAYALRPLAVAYLAGHTAATPPSRGPPSLS